MSDVAIPPAVPDAPQPPPRILIVDDQRNMRTTTALVLRQQGYQVTEAESGEAALSRLLTEPFDVVLTDLKMAPLDGPAGLRGALEISPSTPGIVITGESGTGKELIARAIHVNSKRSSRPFVPVNCAAISETLLESELFGHVKGAFTGAVKLRQGLLEEASGGTFFFDEIAETTPAFQAKLLRVIQEHEIRRVGDNASIPVDVRVIAATNQDLKKAIGEKRFREDLYYRLNVVPLHAPPLRERKEDIPLFAQHFISRFNQRNATRRTFTQGALKKMTAYDFRGNVRELENMVEQAAALAHSDEIDAADVFIEARTAVAPANPDTGVRTLAQEVDDAERRAIEVAMQRNEGQIEKVARELDVSTTTLWRKMKRLGIRKE